jgi:cyclophilin family peptidyl-prolyl cis-trans isomerase
MKNVHLLATTVLAALVMLCAPYPSPALAEAQAPEDAGPPPLALRVGMFQSVYEVESLMRGELSIANTGSEWVTVKGLANLSAYLRLKTEKGEVLSPDQEAAKRFGAVKAESLGPGGFAGLTFDAALLFPALSNPGKYEIYLEHGTLRSAPSELTILPAFDPSSDYRLVLHAAGGKVVIDLFEDEAPVTVRNIVNLARTGFYDDARVPRAVANVALQVSGPVTPNHRIQPIENSGAAMLTGTVLAEPSAPPGRSASQRFSFPNLLVLLEPQPGWQGTAAVVGQVIEGEDTLARMVSLAPGLHIDRGEILQLNPAGQP